MKIKALKVDYKNKQHAADLVYLINSYAEDPMGGGSSLPDEVTNNLTIALSKIPHAFSILSYVDSSPAGLINCFEAFSTFQCKPLINIHDVIVIDEFRGLGISQLMLDEVERLARKKGCCKLTLEILEGNTVAKSSYKKFGFSAYELDPEKGSAMFWQKPL
jgi:GNAT superfamily N-acetyltransferase